jgi:hypothetical protein
MPNPYTNTYMPNGFEEANQQGINPVFQNIGAQQQYMNQQLGQANQLAQPTSRGTNMSGVNPLAMAMMLRDKDPYAANKGDPYLNADTAMNKYGAENVYGYGGKGAIPTSWNGEF